MKKKLVICLAVIAVTAIFIAAGLEYARSRATAKLKGLEAGEIVSVTVLANPPGKEAVLSGEEVAELVEILKDVTVYKKDNSYREYAGQWVEYNIAKTDGTVIEVAAYAPFIIIDGIGYQAKYEPCQALNGLGNRVIESAPVDLNQEERMLEEPPSMQVTCGTQEITVYPGNFSWDYDKGDGTSSGVIACGLHPLDAKEHMQMLENREGSAVLSFGEEPDSITVRCWAGEYWGNTSSQSESIPLKDGKLELKEGEYIYEVTAEWSKDSYKGTAHYTFYTECSK